MTNVVREDVISVGFDFDDSAFSDMLKQVNEFKQELSSGFDMTEIDNIKKNIEPSREAIKDLEEGVLNAKKELSGSVDTSGIDDIKNNTEQVKEVVNNLENGIENVKEELSAGIDTSEIDSVKKNADNAKEAMKGLENSVKNAKSELSADIDTSGIDDVKKSAEQAKGSVKKAAKNLIDIKNAAKAMKEEAEKGFNKIKKSAEKLTFDKIKSSAKNVASKIKSAFTSVENKIKSVANSITSASDTITSKLFNVKSLVVGAATGATVQKSIDIVVDRQNITSQFEVLLGSAEKAQERVNELTDFAGMTPFTRDEIFAASKQLQVFTGNALSTGDSLRVIGDVAAGTGQPFEEVALWTGRLYDALKSGGTVGEMTSRLQEMGAISGEDRTEIEKLVEAGGDIKDKWSVVEGVFSRYNGTMEKLSNNLGNMLTSLKSFAINSIFMPLGEGIASGLQPAIQKFRDFRKSNKADVEAMGEVIHNFAENICVPLFNKIEQGAEFVIKAIGSLKDGISGLNNLKGTSPLLDKLIDAFNFVFVHKDTFIDAFKKIAVAMGGIVAAGKFTKIISALSGLLNPLTLVTAAFGVLFTALKNDSENGGTALTDLKNIAVTVFDAIKDSISVFSEIISNNKAVFTDVINTIVDLLPPLVEAFGELLTAGLELAEVALPVLLDVFKELFNAVKPLLEQLPEFIGFFADIIKACAKAKVIKTLVTLFVAYKIAMFAANAVTKIHTGLLVILRAKTLIATAAQKLLNLAMDANPIMMVVSAIGFLIGAFVSYSALAGDSSDDTNKLRENIDNVTGSVQNMRNAFDNAKVTLPGIEQFHSVNGYTSSDIDTQIADKEKQITDALTVAMQNQQLVRDEDLENIRTYMQDLNDLENEKLSLYTNQQLGQFDVLENQIKFDAKDSQAIADILKGVNEVYDQSVTAINEEFTRRGTTLSEYYRAEQENILKNEKLNSTAKTEAMKGLAKLEEQEQQKMLQEKNDRLAEAQKRQSDTYNLGIEASRNFANRSSGFLDSIKQKTDRYNVDLAYMDNHIADTTREGINKFNEMSINADLQLKQITDILNGVDTETRQQMHNFFILTNEAKNQGVAVSNEAKDQINSILTVLEGLPPETQEAGKQLLAGLMQGMTDENGNLIDTTDMSCQDVINAARDAFDIHSPSKVFAEMGNYIGEGLSQGIEESMPKVTETMTACINDIISSAESFNLDGVGQNAQLMSENVTSSFTQMGESTGKSLSGMKKTVVSIITGMTSIVILNLKNMSLQAVTVLSVMSVNVTATMNQMKSNIDNIDLYSSGVNIMNGLINGMESKQSMLVVTAKSIADTVKNTMSQALDIHSPSRVLYKIGEYTGMGQINGMKSTLPEIQQTANKMGQQSVPDSSDDKKYSPSGSTVSYSRSSTSENVNYAPVFNLTITGTSDDRAMARKIKKMIAEAMEDMASSYESKSRTVREV